MDAKQLRELIIRPTLKHLDPEIPYSTEAEDLLLATACAESQCGYYIKQIGGGPAEGIWQMEPETENDNWENFIYHRGELEELIKYFYIPWQSYSLMILSPTYACAQARVKYYRDPEPLPKNNGYQTDYILDMAEYWKRVYNTESGKGTLEGFLQKAEKYGDFV